MRMILAAILLVANPALAQPVTGTTPVGIFYEVSGAGEPVVFIHAFSVDRRMWARQVASFESRYPARVTRLILASPGLGGYRIPPLPWAAATFAAAGAGDAAGAAKLWAETPIMTLRSNTAERDTVRSLVTDNWRLWTYRRTEQPLQPPAVNRLAEINAPTLVIVGDQDFPYIKDIASAIAKGVNNGRLVAIPGAGHMTNLDEPSLFDAALSGFLGPNP